MAAQGDGLSAYLGLQTTHVHGLLFGLVLPLALAEACLLALIIGWAAVGYERAAGTEQVVATTATGRDAWVWKLVAALLAGLITTGVILGAALGCFLAKFDLSRAWSDRVSSSFNVVPVEGKPFVTWDRLRVADYLLGSVVLGAGLVVCFCLLGVVTTSWIRHQWAGLAVGLGVIAAAYLLARPFPPGHPVRLVLHLSPVWLVLDLRSWFTDGGLDVLWPRFETWGALAWLALLSGLALLAWRHVRREELS
jgi:hypothetical protein